MRERPLVPRRPPLAHQESVQIVPAYASFGKQSAALFAASLRHASFLSTRLRVVSSHYLIGRHSNMRSPRMNLALFAAVSVCANVSPVPGPAGTVQGRLTLNKQPVILKVAYAHLQDNAEKISGKSKL